MTNQIGEAIPVVVDEPIRPNKRPSTDDLPDDPSAKKKAKISITAGVDLAE
jgi:hypothetical protein